MNNQENALKVIIGVLLPQRGAYKRGKLAKTPGVETSSSANLSHLGRYYLSDPGKTRKICLDIINDEFEIEVRCGRHDGA